MKTYKVIVAYVLEAKTSKDAEKQALSLYKQGSYQRGNPVVTVEPAQPRTWLKPCKMSKEEEEFLSLRYD